MLKLFSLATAVVGWPSSQAWKRDQPRRAFRSLVLRHLGWSFPSKKGMMIPLNSYVWDRTTRISWNVQGLSTSNLPNANVFRVVFFHYQVIPFRIGDGAAGSSGESWPRLTISWHSFRHMKFPSLGAWLQVLGDLKQMLSFTQPVGMMFSLVTNIWWKRREISSGRFIGFGLRTAALLQAVAVDGWVGVEWTLINSNGIQWTSKDDALLWLLWFQFPMKSRCLMRETREKVA